jgi:hypothetical protein
MDALEGNAVTPSTPFVVHRDSPRSGNQLMAWAPPGNSLALAAVPVTPEDVKDGLTPAAYRDALATRLVWMIEREESPQQAIDALRVALETRDLWPAVEVQASSLWGQVAELLTDNPEWPDYLNLRVELPDQRSMPVRPIPAAVRAVQDTTFAEWMDLAFGALTSEEPGADRALARQRGIQAIEKSLPPGWSVVDEDGAISVLDPNGDWHQQFDAPPVDVAGLAAEVAALHEQGVQNGVYTTSGRETGNQIEEEVDLFDRGPLSLLSRIERDDLLPEQRAAYARRLRSYLDWHARREVEREKRLRIARFAAGTAAAIGLYLAFSFDGPVGLTARGTVIGWTVALAPGAAIILRAVLRRRDVPHAVGYALVWGLCVMLGIRAFVALSVLMFGY